VAAAAACSGVIKSLSRQLTSAPALTNSSTISFKELTNKTSGFLF
jgi:hypothetical protein